MRILFVRHTSLGRVGGGAPHHFPLNLGQSGHQVTVMARTGGDGGALTRAGIRVIEVSRKESWLSSLRKSARFVRPDIVHVFLHRGCGLYPFALRTGSRPRFVLDIRSPLLRTGPLGYLRRLLNRLETVGYDAVSTHGIESGRTVIGNGRDMVWVPPGVDLSALPVRCERRAGTGPMRLVYIGSLDRKRRIEEMVAAVSLAADDISLSLDIYGGGDGKERIRRMVEERGMAQTIRLLGAVPHTQLFERLSACDIGLAYVPRALYDTALPLKTLEYMACGLPVLGTDTVGNRMVVQARVNGLLVDDDAESFAKGIRELAQAPWLSGASENARRSVEPYDWARIVSEKLMPLYQGVLVKG